MGTVTIALGRQSLARPAAGVARSPAERHSLPMLHWREDGGPMDIEPVNQRRDDDRM